MDVCSSRTKPQCALKATVCLWPLQKAHWINIPPLGGSRPSTASGFNLANGALGSLRGCVVTKHRVPSSSQSPRQEPVTSWEGMCPLRVLLWGDLSGHNIGPCLWASARNSGSFLNRGWRKTSCPGAPTGVLITVARARLSRVSRAGACRGCGKSRRRRKLGLCSWLGCSSQLLLAGTPVSSSGPRPRCSRVALSQWLNALGLL